MSAAPAAIDGYIDSHYARTRTPDAPRQPLQSDLEARVCIVGGGLAGLATALGLAERGVEGVVLLEAKRVGWGASGRNGGFVSAGYDVGAARLVAMVGLDHARRLLALGRDALALLRARIDRYAIACGPHVEGHLGVSWWDDAEGLKRRVAFAGEHLGAAFQFVPRERVREEFAASEMYFDAVFNPDAFWFHPLNFCLGMARAAEAAGVAIYENTPVQRVVADGGPTMAATDGGIVEAENLVMTAGAYDRSLLPEIGGAMQPVATYMVVTEPVAGERLAATLKCRNPIWDDRFGLDYYRRLEDGRILWGGRGSTRTREPAGLRQLLASDLARVYPALAGIGIEAAWSGLMSFSRHGMVQAGRLRPGLWYAQGFGGQGMAQTTVAGEALAAAIAGGDFEALALFRPFGLDWTGGPFGRLYGDLYRSWRIRREARETARHRRLAGRAA